MSYVCMYIVIMSLVDYMAVQPAKLVQTGKEKFAETKCGRDIASVCSEVLRTDIFHVELQGHARLFKDQFQFSKASSLFSERPKLCSEEVFPGGIISDQFPMILLELIVQSTICGIHQFLFDHIFDNSTETPDAIFLQSFSKFFIKEPCVTAREIYFKCVGNKPIGKGSIDVLAGMLSNDKLHVKVKADDHTMKDIFVWVINEAKAPTVRLSSDIPGSRVPAQEDLKSLYQPITKLCSFSELCELPNNLVPVIALFGSRYSFRPLLYFKAYDVLLTTSRSYTFFDSKKQVDLHGIVMLRVLSMLANYPFSKTFLESTTKLGWEAAKIKENCDNIFNGVHLSVEKDGVEEQGQDNPNDVSPPIVSVQRSITMRTFSDRHDST